MRAPLILLIPLTLGLVAAALLALREGGEPRATRLAAAASAPVAADAPASAAPAPSPAPVPVPASAPPAVRGAAPSRIAAASPVVAAPSSAQPALPEARPQRAVFALSSDHQALLQNTLLAAADHEQLERESRDDAWATESERLIRDELAKQGASANADFDIVAVDCRQTVCAIEAFSYGEDGHREWAAAMDAAFKESLGRAFTSINTAMPDDEGRAPVMTFLHRRPANPGP
jgi:hypothetical protein